MRRTPTTKSLTILVAALVALASFGPRPTYAHSHPISAGGHHDHDQGDHDGPAHDDHDLPSLSNSDAHVHCFWLGFVVTLPLPEGTSATEGNLSSTTSATHAIDQDAGLFGPLKERIPWLDLVVPPEPFCLSSLIPCPSPNPLLARAGTSCAITIRTHVLRC